MRAYLIGIGLVLFAVHNPNQPFLSYAFLPQIGLSLLIGAIISYPFKKLKESFNGSNSPAVWLPLMLVSFAIVMSGIAQYWRGEVKLIGAFAPLATVIVWWGVYLASRIEGEKIGKPIAVAVIIESVSVLVIAFVSGGNRGGGIISPTNYDIATAFLVFGTFLSPRKWQWWLSSFAVVGLFFSGAEEGIVAIGAAFLIFLILKDISVKTLLPVSALILAVLVATPMGITKNLYLKDKPMVGTENPSTLDKFQAVQKAVQNIGGSQFNEDMDIATGYRFSTHWRIRPVQPFGYGYNLTNFYWGIPHNQALIIIEQVGLFGLFWFVPTFYLFRKSKRYYLWASVLALGIFDHYTWTQIAPWWWAMVGISEAHSLESGNIFREVKVEVPEMRGRLAGQPAESPDVC